MKDRIGQEVNEGDFIVYCAKDRNAYLAFGWVDKIKTETSTGYNGHVHVRNKIKIVHAEADGSKKEKTRFAFDPVENRYRTMNTGKVSTSWLESGENDHRMMVVKPFN